MKELISTKKSNLKIFGKDLEVQSLTLKQTIFLGEILGSISSKIKENLSDKKDLSDVRIFMEILKTSGLEKSGEIINILLNWQISDKTNKEISEQISLEEISGLIRALSETNDFKEIFINFKTAFEKLKI